MAFFVTSDAAFVRRWAERRGLRPVLRDDGRLALAHPDGPAAIPLTWPEFAGLFTVARLALAWDDQPDSPTHELVPHERGAALPR